MMNPWATLADVPPFLAAIDEPVMTEAMVDKAELKLNISQSLGSAIPAPRESCFSP
jgi:hypothetical protein